MMTLSTALLLWSTIILGIWAAVGPLVGIRYGQELAKRWQQEQWVRENRKQECRELLDVLYQHAAANLGAASDPAGLISIAFHKTIKSRIFIAGDLAKSKFEERWYALLSDAKRHSIQSEEYVNAREALTAEVRKLAME